MGPHNELPLSSVSLLWEHGRRGTGWEVNHRALRVDRPQDLGQAEGAAASAKPQSINMEVWREQPASTGTRGEWGQDIAQCYRSVCLGRISLALRATANYGSPPYLFLTQNPIMPRQALSFSPRGPYTPRYISPGVFGTV